MIQSSEFIADRYFDKKKLFHFFLTLQSTSVLLTHAGLTSDQNALLEVEIHDKLCINLSLVKKVIWKHLARDQFPLIFVWVFKAFIVSLCKTEIIVSQVFTEVRLESAFVVQINHF